MMLLVSYALIHNLKQLIATRFEFILWLFFAGCCFFSQLQ